MLTCYICNYICKIANFINKIESNLYLIDSRIVDLWMSTILC